MNKTKSRRHTQVEKAELVQNFRTSSQTQTAWCNDHCISTKTLHQWLKDNKIEKEQSWAPVYITSEKTHKSSNIITVQIGKLKKMKLCLKENRTLPVKELIMRINRSLVGHFNYYGVTGNGNSISTFRYRVVGLLFTWLNRRSQRKSYTWESFYHGLLQTFPVAMTKIYVNLFE